MADDPVLIRQLDPQPVASIRGRCEVARLGDEMGARLAQLIPYLQRLGAEAAGPPFVRYHTFDPQETDFEIGIPVRVPVAGEGDIAGGELPGGPAAVVALIGSPDDNVRNAYARLQSGIAGQGREADGPPWEVYFWIDPRQPPGPATWADPTTWQMEIVQPLL